jgi:adenosylmethionine-8-amino-7-oxononanoate aminotransferase
MTSTELGLAFWNPQAQMPTALRHRLVIARGEGAYLYTEAGDRLLDATASLWYCNVGHARPELADAAAKQLRELETYHVFGPVANRPALELADRIAALVPIPDAKVILGSGGSDAVDTAAKLARRHWQLHGRPDKRIVLSRDLGYHGLHAFGTSIGGLQFNRDGYGGESLVPETARVATNDAGSLAEAVRTLGADRIAAFFAEPVIGTGGVIPPAPGYLEAVQAICRDNDVLFVTDEVITGFGRTGAMFASERFGLEPDMLLFAKGVTSGYLPLGGIAVARNVWEPFFAGDDAPIFRHGVTYSGHATACAVALANLDVLERDRLVERVADLESALVDALEPLRHLDEVVEVRCGVGLLGGVQLREDVSAEAVAYACRDLGVMTRPITNNTLQISPPFVVDADELGVISDAIGTALDRRG